MNNTALSYTGWTQSSDPNFKSPTKVNAFSLARTMNLNPLPKPPAVREHPVWVINTNEGLRSLKKPVVLQVKIEGDTYFAENNILEICGYGDSPSKALDDAIKELAYCYEYYGNLNENEVIGHGVTIRNRFLDL